MIKQIGLPLRGRPILLITCMITDRIGLHSVLLQLHIPFYLKMCISFLFFFQKKWEALAPRAPPPSQALYKVPFYFLCAVYCDNLQQLNGEGIGRKLQRLKLSFYHCLKIKTLTGNILKYCSREEDFSGVIDKSCRVLTFLFWMDYSCV